MTTTAADIVERLRNRYTKDVTPALLDEAADVIESLREAVFDAIESLEEWGAAEVLAPGIARWRAVAAVVSLLESEDGK